MKRPVRLVILVALAAAVTAGGAGARGHGASPLDGTWTWTWTRADVLRGDTHAGNDISLVGRYIATFANGRVTSRNLRTGHVGRSRFSVRGSVVGFVFSQPEPGVVPGRTYELKWSIYRDRLRFAELPGRAVLTMLPVKPWTRVA